MRGIDATSDPGTLYLRVQLQSPVGVNYDLYLYDNCGPGPIAGSASTGTLDEINYSWPDVWLNDESQDFWIEIRYMSGNSCANWNL
jgi:hypothetical protein